MLTRRTDAPRKASIATETLGFQTLEGLTDFRAAGACLVADISLNETLAGD